MANYKGSSAGVVSLKKVLKGASKDMVIEINISKFVRDEIRDILYIMQKQGLVGDEAKWEAEDALSRELRSGWADAIIDLDLSELLKQYLGSKTQKAENIYKIETEIRALMKEKLKTKGKNPRYDVKFIPKSKRK